MNLAAFLLDELLRCLESKEGNNYDANIVCHPSYFQQKQCFINLCAAVTAEYVQEHIIQPLGYYMQEFQRLKNGGGVINLCYILKVRRNDDIDQTQQWLLRVCNPHRFWIDIKTQIEINTIRMVSKFCPNVPIPAIIDDSYSNCRPCKFQYILFEFVHGSVLHKIEDDLSANQKRKILRQLIDIVHSLRNDIPDSVLEDKRDGNKLGTYFATNDDQMQYGCLRQDGPPLGPFCSALEYFQQHFDWTIRALLHIYFDSDQKHGVKRNLYDLQTIQKLRKSLNKVMEIYIKPLQEKVDQIEMKSGDRMYHFNHCDLNPSNILVDDEQNIVAIIDWETSRVDPFAHDISTLNWYIEERWKLEAERVSVGNAICEQLHKINEVKNFCCDLVFFSVTWWTPLIENEQMTDDDILPYVVQESNTGYTNLVAKLQELDCWHVSTS